ncbi:TPA: terminase large subunit domain-containing protein [Yersinia enterocolitica]|uniref:terminase large subunit domain-containing protein n=1 Tax=Yersinia TaxID=629 RepID=UPI0005DF6D24|nr:MULTISPECIES: terminase family protein [Yersinia]EKN3559838.1 terminase family protein [Yersinia enterocolitica]EKN3870813.1 terminase family protein [Yersinia enterocolitica]EKN4750405.1 terminase family protein [Yersinia enterocolitica]EKN4871897.1 terminase family protein [Yersinia enterocolitica]EKN6012219.1 terminase [Yersinia enterocolitica]
MKSMTFTAGQVDGLREHFENSAFDYQKAWYRVGQTGVARNITKSRQIGADWLFAFEALLDALTTGRNQHFLTVSRYSALTTRATIAEFCRVVRVNVNPCSLNNILLGNGALIAFHGENSHAAAQTGNVYLGEYAWAKNPRSILQMAKGIAMHKNHRLTLYTTPSRSHIAFKIWNSSLQHPRKTAPVIHTNNGVFCADDVFRQSVTTDDAIQQGCTLWEKDWDKGWLEKHMTADDFKLLYLCDWSQAANNAGEVK